MLADPVFKNRDLVFITCRNGGEEFLSVLFDGTPITIGRINLETHQFIQTNSAYSLSASQLNQIVNRLEEL